MTSDPVERAVAAMRLGTPVLLRATEDAGAGSVLAVSADRTSEDTVNLMTQHARGMVIGVALTAERADKLGLGLQGELSHGLARENYTVSVEAREGVSTGISAADRARTAQLLADRRARMDDFVTPGHVFPTIAAAGGVIERPGYSEACVDLARIAGVQPIVSFCHALDDAGEIATPEAVTALGEALDVPVVDIEAIIARRMATETFVTQVTQTRLPTAHGDFMCRVFHDELSGKQHLALTLGNLRGGDPVLVRLHSECLTGDVLGSLRCDCGKQLHAALEAVAAQGRGAVLYLRQEGRGIGLVNKVGAYRLQDEGRDTVEANLELGFEADQRDFGLGAQILVALGAQRVKLLTNNPRKVKALEAYGLDIVSREPLEFAPGPFNEAYLRTKKEKLGHLLTKV